MRPLIASIVGPISAAAYSAPLVLDAQQRSFNVTVAIIPNSAATVSATAQYTNDDPNPPRVRGLTAGASPPGTPGYKAGLTRIPCTISITSDVATITTPVNHMLRTGDSVTLIGTGIGADGYYPVVTVTSATTFTVPMTTTATADTGVTEMIGLRWYPSTNLATKSSFASESLNSPVRAARLEAITLTGTGSQVDLEVSQGLGRG